MYMMARLVHLVGTALLTGVASASGQDPGTLDPTSLPPLAHPDPINGSTWQVMRLSRNRNWGHPKLIAFLESLASKGRRVGWNGLLVGDLSQPRGGPMLSGHNSHQVGLDADIWLTQMPDRTLSREEREFVSAVNLVREHRSTGVDPRTHRADPHGGGGRER
jgi:penicillin-insensitive murein DD-endopeptidase